MKDLFIFVSKEIDLIAIYSDIDHVSPEKALEASREQQIK